LRLFAPQGLLHVFESILDGPARGIVLYDLLRFLTDIRGEEKMALYGSPNGKRRKIDDNTSKWVSL